MAAVISEGGIGHRAWVRLDGWAGRSFVEGTVIGETPKRYRFRWGGNAYGRTAGSVSLVPKYAVTFDPSVEPAGSMRR